MSILTTTIFFLSKQPLALIGSKYLWYMKTSFRIWWFSIVLCWISFPMPIHMLHSEFGCENYTTSKMTIFTKFMHFHTVVFWSGMPTSATCRSKSRKIRENFSIGRSQSIQQGTLNNLRISFPMHHSSFMNSGFD